MTLVRHNAHKVGVTTTGLAPQKELAIRARLLTVIYVPVFFPQVSLDSRVREIINRNMIAPSQHTFDEAQLQIYTLMHRDSYPRFVNSPTYKELLRTCGVTEMPAAAAAAAAPAAAAGPSPSAAAASTPTAKAASSPAAAGAAAAASSSPSRGGADGGPQSGT